MHGTLYNYADDNTLSFSCPDFYRLTQVLQPESLILINWFHDNCMQANPDKFQTIAVGERIFEKNLVLKIFDTEIKCKEVLKLLGVDIDYKLNFDQHISNLCRNAGQQLNVLKRLSPFLSRLNKQILHIYFIKFIYCPLARKTGQQLNVLKRLSPFLSRMNKQYFTHLFHQILIIVRLLGIFVVRIILESWKTFRNVHYGLCMRIVTLLMKNFWTKQKFLPFMLEDSEQWLWKLSRF